MIDWDEVFTEETLHKVVGVCGAAVVISLSAVMSVGCMALVWIMVFGSSSGCEGAA